MSEQQTNNGDLTAFSKKKWNTLASGSCTSKMRISRCFGRTRTPIIQIARLTKRLDLLHLVHTYLAEPRLKPRWRLSFASPEIISVVGTERRGAAVPAGYRSAWSWQQGIHRPSPLNTKYILPSVWNHLSETLCRLWGYSVAFSFEVCHISSSHRNDSVVHPSCWDPPAAGPGLLWAEC